MPATGGYGLQGACPGLANVGLPESLWTVPISSCSGRFTSGVNPFYDTAQFNYAAKHDGVPPGQSGNG